MKTAVVHDYFTQLGGAERVAQELFHLAPNASLFATVGFPECLPPGLKSVTLNTTWMQNMPGLRRLYRAYFLVYPLAVNSLDLSGFDLVLSSSIAYAKGVRTHPDQLHVCYCHTPMRWVWNYNNYVARESFGWAKKALLPTIVGGLKQWDVGAAREPDHFVANSRSVAALIRQVYGRVAEVINPPIEVSRFHISPDVDDYYLVLARLIAYKRVDLAVRACTRLGKKLVVIGTGQERQRLEAIAGPTVKFLGRVSDLEVNRYASRCKALLFTGEEDFGMAPLEVAAAGRPTIAFRAGGAVETIIEESTGLFFDTQTAEDLEQAILRLERQEWCSALIRRHAESYSVSVFQRKFRAFLRRVGAPVDTMTSTFEPEAACSAHELQAS